jgi:hypothetical protein
MSDTESKPEESAAESSAESSSENTGGDPSQDRLQKLVEAQLAPIKANLDKAYAARDEAIKKLAKYEADLRAAEVQRLKDEGKHREAFEQELAAERAARQELEQRNIELTRDITVKGAMQALPFRNARSFDMAFKEITALLVKNEQGEWVHKSGVSVPDFIKTFAEDENNSFLFKSKTSTGTGSAGDSLPPDTSGSSSSLFALPQDEVLRRAAAGQLRRAPT